MALSIVVGLFIFGIGMAQPVKATEFSVKQATEYGATISEETDKATNEKPEMSTEFFMYIPPDPVYDIPKMGDEGVNVISMILGALSVGVCYLALQVIYAEKKET